MVDEFSTKGRLDKISKELPEAAMDQDVLNARRATMVNQPRNPEGERQEPDIVAHVSVDKQKTEPARDQKSRVEIAQRVADLEQVLEKQGYAHKSVSMEGRIPPVINVDLSSLELPEECKALVTVIKDANSRLDVTLSVQKGQVMVMAYPHIRENFNNKDTVMGFKIEEAKDNKRVVQDRKIGEDGYVDASIHVNGKDYSIRVACVDLNHILLATRKG